MDFLGTWALQVWCNWKASAFARSVWEQNPHRLLGWVVQTSYNTKEFVNCIPGNFFSFSFFFLFPLFSKNVAFSLNRMSPSKDYLLNAWHWELWACIQEPVLVGVLEETWQNEEPTWQRMLISRWSPDCLRLNRADNNDPLYRDDLFIKEIIERISL